MILKKVDTLKINTTQRSRFKLNKDEKKFIQKTSAAFFGYYWFKFEQF
jgi:hypothetical protein